MNESRELDDWSDCEVDDESVLFDPDNDDDAEQDADEYLYNAMNKDD